ncbi:hypothetical protein [Inquilinus sp.]|jgi:hypothetical protein|uniref:hypothetical protein n=1 Tax=Inquilinus sp. TaxID=1932117 RepID=UPI003783D066
MMDCLIVWSALGPILAFIAGAVVVAWWDDEEDETPVARDQRAQTGGAMRGQVVPFEPTGRTWPAWDLPPSPGAGYPMQRMTPSRVPCGRRDEWP